jgi:hypothetical protein
MGRESSVSGQGHQRKRHNYVLSAARSLLFTTFSGPHDQKCKRLQDKYLVLTQSHKATKEEEHFCSVLLCDLRAFV